MRILALCLLMCGCTNTTDPILVTNVCTESHSETYTYMVYQSNGRGGGHMSPRVGVKTVCDMSFDVQYPNPNYKEPQP